MSDEKALLAAIWEHPHEDTPRLAYADWLEENGQPEQAEFIRLQCELAQFDEWWGLDDAPATQKQREQELWRKWRTRWRSYLPRERRTCTFHRGFPMFEMSYPRFRDLLKLTVADLEYAPLMRYHGVFGGRALQEMLKWPGLRFQLEFMPSSPLPKGWVKKVAACDNLRNVSELDLHECELKPAELRMLLDAWADRHLTHLSLPRKSGDELLAVLASHPTAAKIRLLGVPTGKVTIAGIRSLCSSRPLAQVKMFDLHCPIGDAGLEELLRWRHLSGIRGLRLCDAKLTDAGAVALAECPALAELRVLVLVSNSIDVDGCRALARSPHLNRLFVLRLDANPGIRKLAVRKELKARFGKAME
ncbi:MAG TPA: TIGR02996 domain-containing protein [Gemmataceae bacterium]|nr:TIGR02996 domain-containing protein [Gemmataceae bacterium]